MTRLLPAFPALFVLLWSTGFIGARYAMPHAEPLTFLSIRYALALLLLVPVALLGRGAWPGRRLAAHAMVAGSLIHGVYLGGVFTAVRHGLPAGVVALVVGLQPLLTAILAARVLGEAIRPRHWAGLALGLLGAGLVVAPKMGFSGSVVEAATLAPAVLATVAIAAGTVWQKRFVTGVDLAVGTALQYVGALVPTLLVATLSETMRVEWTGELVFALAWLVVVLSIGAVLLLLVLIREGAVSAVSSLMYLVPGVTAVMAFILFGERLAGLQLAGMALAGIGVAAAAGRRGPRVPTEGRRLGGRCGAAR